VTLARHFIVDSKAVSVNTVSKNEGP